ncbi:uncharacterized protein [Chelonus insularis]|uniref:uncharacterized protein n=1 Tax=Chelonus insularis TaxID=460826 RepID=UPI00158BD250|nr:uncharacterized protein LOC118073983 [Chelonus insularis]
MLFPYHFRNLYINIVLCLIFQLTNILIKNVSSEMSQKYVVANEDEFKNAYDLLEVLTTEQPKKLNRTVVTPKPIVGDYWMKKMGHIREDLLRIQAIIVKDEDVEGPCNQGHQKTQRRFLMCAGSILNRNRILTTASCLQEAINVRHNIRAPLSVVIAPLKPSIQVIRIAEYRIHPKHITNPYSADNPKHNLAILSLACRISSVNYHKIELPTLPMTHICTEENCIIAVYRQSGYMNVIYQILAPQIPSYDRRRRSIIDESKEKISELNRKMKTDVFYDDSDLNLFKNFSDHRIFKRSSNGLRACPQTGAAVMVNDTQTAIIATSCDDRQGHEPFLYTDLYYNQNWINSVLNNWNKPEYTEDESSRADVNKTHSTKNCGNCIFNFYISVGCKGGKGNCLKNQGMLYNQQPKIIHNTRQVSNQEFMEAWSDTQKPTNSWSNSRRVGSHNIQETLSKQMDRCPSNSPGCLQSLAEMNEIHQRIPTGQVKEEVNMANEKPTRLVVNNPVMMRGRNYSHGNDMDRMFRYNGLQNVGNRSWFLRNPSKPIQSPQNIYDVKGFNNKKLIQEERNNWLRRRHANNYVNPQINHENPIIKDSEDIDYCFFYSRNKNSEMSSRWNILMIFLFLIVGSLQEYQPYKLDIKNKFKSKQWHDDQRIESDTLHQLNENETRDSASSDTREVCKFKSCSDNPVMMTRDSPKQNTFLLTFSQVNLSNSNNVSLENSRSSTFFDFKKNSKQRKSNVFPKNPTYLNQTLRNVLKIITKILMSQNLGMTKRNDMIETGHINLTNEQSFEATTQLSLMSINEINRNNGRNEEINDIYDKVSAKLGDFQPENEKNNLNNGIKNQFKRRVKRRINLERWISQEYEGEEEMMKMHAFIVRDEVIPSCCTAARSVSATRYFMCSGAILTLTHAITTASCMLFADLYEKHIRADLAVLVGGSTSSPYVIKINHYEMHPNYVYDIDDPNHAKNNLAILFLNCGFSFMMGTIVPPKLPQGIYDDVGHICCGENCEIITIIQKADNHHVARVLKAKHIPPPAHDLNDNNKRQHDGRRRMKMRKSHKVKRNVSSWIRYKRSPGKLAEAPSFLFRDSEAASTTAIKSTEKSSNSKRENIKNILDEIANAKKQSVNNVTHAKNNTLNILTEDGRRELIQRIAANLSMIDEKLSKVDWMKIEQIMESKIPNANKEKIEKFANSVVDETIKRLGTVIEVDGENSKIDVQQVKELPSERKTNVFMSLLNEKAQQNRSFGDFTNIFTDIITSLLPPKGADKLSVSSDLVIEEQDLSLPPPKYINCPPLGAPIFKNETLIAMVAYTCDDVESWVQWKYVSISRNLNWIRQRIAVEQKPPPTLCDSPFSGEEMSLDQLIHGSRTLTARKNLPFFPAGFEDNEAYRIIRNQLKKAKETKKYAQNLATTLSETDEVKNRGYLQNSNQINQNFKWRRAKTEYPAPINVNSNTCVTKPDGSTECQSLSESSKDQ